MAQRGIKPLYPPPLPSLMPMSRGYTIAKYPALHSLPSLLSPVYHTACPRYGGHTFGPSCRFGPSRLCNFGCLLTVDNHSHKSQWFDCDLAPSPICYRVICLMAWEPSCVQKCLDKYSFDCHAQDTTCLGHIRHIYCIILQPCHKVGRGNQQLTTFGMCVRSEPFDISLLELSLLFCTSFSVFMLDLSYCTLTLRTILMRIL